jgi:cytochrome c oxidase subunit II
MDQSSLLSLLGAELKKMELSSTMIFLLTDRKMLLSSSKPIMIATRGMPGIPLNRESESVEDVHRVLRALPLFREMEGILRERNLNLPSVQEISAFRVNLFSGIRRESAIADYDAFWRSLLEEIHTPQGRSCFGQRIQDLHARMSAEGNWDYLIAQQGRGYFGNLPNLNSPLDQYQFGIHPILDLNIGEYYVSFTNLSLFMLLTLGLVLLLVLPMILRLLECRFFTIALCDAAEPWQLGFQDAATPMMQGIIDLHHDIFFFLILILVFVLWMLVRALWHFNEQTNPIPQRIVHGTTIEIIWTIFPSVILLFIAIPSFALLYSMDGVLVDPAITIKAIGHQWYWTYEYSDYNSSDEQSLTFDSYMIPEDDLELGQLRLLEVDNRVVVPAKTHLRMIVTSADVLHSWAVPSLGVKCDAVPGRLNLTSILVQREGVYYGQCSEICGTNHAFMPIVVEAVTLKDYADWVSNQLILQTN